MSADIHPRDIVTLGQLDRYDRWREQFARGEIKVRLGTIQGMLLGFQDMALDANTLSLVTGVWIATDRDNFRHRGKALFLPDGITENMRERFRQLGKHSVRLAVDVVRCGGPIGWTYQIEWIAEQ